MKNCGTKLVLVAISSMLVACPVAPAVGAVSVDTSGPQDVPETWSEYVSTRGHFSVQFPSSPKIAELEDGVGEMVVSGAGDQAYIASWKEFSEVVDPKVRMSKFVEGSMKGVNGEIIRSTPITLGSWPGIRYIFRAKDQGGVSLAGECYVYARGRLLYGLTALGPEPLDRSTFRNFERFFRSLKITAAN